jgi:hypothetical protein
VQGSAVVWTILIAFFSISNPKFILKIKCWTSSKRVKGFGVRHYSLNLGTGGLWWVISIFNYWIIYNYIVDFNRWHNTYTYSFYIIYYVIFYISNIQPIT